MKSNMFLEEEEEAEGESQESKEFIALDMSVPLFLLPTYPRSHGEIKRENHPYPSFSSSTSSPNPSNNDNSSNSHSIHFLNNSNQQNFTLLNAIQKTMGGLVTTPLCHSPATLLSLLSFALPDATYSHHALFCLSPSPLSIPSLFIFQFKSS